MSYQGCKVRGVALAVVAIGATVGLAACKSPGEVTGGGGNPQALSSGIFDVTFATSGPGDLAVSVNPDHGDAWLEADTNGSSKLEWTASQSFGIKFVQIDDQEKEQKRKFGRDQQPGWNEAKLINGMYTVSFKLDAGTSNPRKKKEIRGAKYIIASPSGCSDLKPIPAGCKWQDPVIIVRY